MPVDFRIWRRGLASEKSLSTADNIVDPNLSANNKKLLIQGPTPDSTTRRGAGLSQRHPKSVVSVSRTASCLNNFRLHKVSWFEA
jgi:hypothetical protein